MIKIEVLSTSKSAMKVIAQGDIKGYDNAVNQMFAVLAALDRMSSEVLADAIGKYIELQIGGNDDESES